MSELSAELQANLQRAAQDADMVQNACNLSGVARSFREVLKDVLWPVAGELGKGTEWVNTHPICALFIDKMASLARTQYNDQVVYRAFDACRRIAAGDDTGWSVEELESNAK